jgi:predicted dehydrogenase
LVEKPAGVSLVEVVTIAEAAERSGAVAKVGFNHRFHPAVRQAYTLASQGAVGDLMFIRARYGHGGRLGYEHEWRCDPRRSGGGELIDQGAHLIDLSAWFLGPMTLEHAAIPTYFWNTTVEDNAFLSLRGATGARAWLHATWTEWKNLFSFEIYGRDGKLAIDGLGGSYGVERLSYYRMGKSLGPPNTTIWEYPGEDRSWAEEMDDFAEAVTNGRRPTGDISDAVDMFRIIDAAYHAGHS